MTNKVIIELKNICKIYHLDSDKNFFALKDVNLTIYQGDNIGIIGNNGTGKTTLLKIISGIVKPTSGEVKVEGKVVSLMNLEDGFNSELSGRENIFLNGLLLGMSREKIIRNSDKIIEFSGIRDFIDEPFYKYSTGMKFRLAFSVAIVSKCDVMIMDEMFMVGDFDFQLKWFQTLKRLQKKRKNLTTIICSHLPDFVWGFSNRFFIADKGIIKDFKRQEMFRLIRKRDKIWKRVLNLSKIM